MVMVTQLCECTDTQCHRTAHVKMAKMANFTKIFFKK